MDKSRRVLVVGLDAGLEKVTSGTLAGRGCDVAWAKDAREAETMLKMQEWHLLVVDIMMPSLDGIEVSLRLRQLSRLPILMLTTWGAGLGQVRALNLASDTYLTAPFGDAELVDMVNAAFRRTDEDAICVRPAGTAFAA